MEANQISWKRVIIFMVIGTIISNVFRFDVFYLESELKQLPAWIFVPIAVLLEGSGIFIGALITISLLTKRRKTVITFFGTSKPKGLLMVIIPIIFLPIIGVDNEFGMNSHLYGFVAITGTILYCIMEEYGWRGYLQEELKDLKQWQKYSIIGFLWYLWHLSFLTTTSLTDNLFFLGMLIFGSWGIGQVVASTKSILAGACFHMIIQIMMFNQLIKNGISGTEKIIFLGVVVAVWFIIIKKWEKEDSINKLPNEE